MTTNVNIRIDDDLKNKSESILNGLEVKLASAINYYLRQIVIKDVPYVIDFMEPNEKTLKSFEESEKIKKDPNYPRYKTFEEFKEAVESDLQNYKNK